MLQRLQKVLAAAGLASRRHCEELIRQGRVQVNGAVVTALGTKVDPVADQLLVDGQPVRSAPKVYLALHKPAGVICTRHDPQGRRRVTDLLPAELPLVFTVGRLDFDSEGLLLLTNDGSFGLRLTHPRYKMPKTYRVEVAGSLTRDQIAQMRRGVESEGETLCAERIVEIRGAGGRTEWEFVLREGRNRQIRRMLAAVGRDVRRLARVAIGPIQLGNLRTGQWRYLTHEEVHKLMHFQSGAQSGSHARPGRHRSQPGRDDSTGAHGGSDRHGPG